LVDLRSSSALVFGLREFELYAVDAIDAVHEEDENEDEGDLGIKSGIRCRSVFSVLPYFQPILQLGDYRALGDEGEEAALDVERQWYDERHEHQHLKHEQCKDLAAELLA
jgi:hypothetical protein